MKALATLLTLRATLKAEYRETSLDLVTGPYDPFADAIETTKTVAATKRMTEIKQQLNQIVIQLREVQTCRDFCLERVAYEGSGTAAEFFEREWPGYRADDELMGMTCAEMDRMVRSELDREDWEESERRAS